MSVLVVGCGRSGTNMALEILTGNSFFKASKKPRDMEIWTRDIILEELFLKVFSLVTFFGYEP